MSNYQKQGTNSRKLLKWQRKTQSSQNSTVVASVTPERGISLLQRQIEKASEYLSKESLPENEYHAWETLTRDFLIKSFGSNSPHIAEVMNIGHGFAVASLNKSPSQAALETRRIGYLKKKVRTLETLIEILQTNIELQIPHDKEMTNDKLGESIFIVHGHDEKILNQVARYLEQLDLDVIILQEEANEGRTIIEKFVDHSQKVGFAVVLLTPDDKGGKINDNFESYQPRARQNVIFELGYFLGRLGRERVCALYSEGVEIPSDYTGVLFTPVDKNETWKLILARELKATGINVDMNKIR